MTFEDETGSAVVAFRGTEMKTDVLNDLVLADLGLGVTTNTLQQQSAKDYMAYIDKTFNYNSYYLAGHSLGGNLAVHALLTASNKIQRKIISCYSYDGPGNSQRYLAEHWSDCVEEGSKIFHYQCSFIGGLLFQPFQANEYKIATDQPYTSLLDVHNVRYFSFDANGNPVYNGYTFTKVWWENQGIDLLSQGITNVIDSAHLLEFWYSTQNNIFMFIGDNISDVLSTIFHTSTMAAPPRDPLIIDLGAQGVELTSVDDGVYFDLDKNGYAEKTAWIKGTDGLLVMDRNGNGIIDDGGELFSD